MPTWAVWQRRAAHSFGASRMAPLPHVAPPCTSIGARVSGADAESCRKNDDRPLVGRPRFDGVRWRSRAKPAHRLLALTIDYNQRHRVELESAARIAVTVGAAEHIVLPLDLRRVRRIGADRRYRRAERRRGGQRYSGHLCPGAQHYLPVADAWAGPKRAGAQDIFIGVNALDYSGYPDCRPEFIAGFEALARLATRDGVDGVTFNIHAPLQHMTKADIAARGGAARPGRGDELVLLRSDTRRSALRVVR